MPPPESRQLSPAERDQLTDWAEQLWSRPDAGRVRNPGRALNPRTQEGQSRLDKLNRIDR